MNENPQSIRLFTLNCWGLKYLAKHRHERLSHIGVEIAAADPPPDIVGLQECWTQQDYLSIRDSTRGILPYGKYYHGGIFGAGLAILSRWPIEESSMFRYPLNGRPTAFFRGDWFVGKGVACARIRLGSGRGEVAEVFCTHLHAPYEQEPNDSYICHRTAQAWEIAKLMRGAAERGHLVVGLGDFNMIPLSFAHRLLEAHAPVRDVWRVLHPDSSVGAAVDAVEKRRERPVPNARFNTVENGATCDSVLNTWRWNKEHQRLLDKGRDIMVEDDTPDPRAKRLDYIFLGNSIFPSNETLGQWRVESANVGMTMRHPTLRCSLSDHFSVEATITRSSSAAPIDPSSISATANGAPTSPLSAYEQSVLLPSTSEEKYTQGPPPTSLLAPLSSSFYGDILAMIHKYTLRERRQRRLRLGHFIGQLCTSIGCLVAVWWSPHNYVAFILMLISTLGLSAGVIDGLIGGLFVGSELRALKEFRWEVENARAGAWEREEGAGILNPLDNGV